MQAIQTKYHGPTNNSGARISATCAAGRVFMGYKHQFDLEGNHKAAAEYLCAKLGWTEPGRGELVTGSLKDGSYVHVFTKWGKSSTRARWCSHD